jgi:hypothetical protein
MSNELFEDYDSYGFLDAQERHKRYPETFESPDHNDLYSIKKGDFVKVCTGNERFWTIITKISKGGIITAIVDNDLILPHSFKCGDKIMFNRNNILNIIKQLNLNKFL